MASTFAESGLKVLLVSLPSSAKINFQGLETIEIPVIKGRFLKKWIDFARKIQRKKTFSAKYYIACDLYSLPAARKFSQKDSARLLYDSREIYSALGPLSGSKIKQMALASIEKNYIRGVDEIIVSGPLDADFLRKYFRHDIPYHVIMNLPPFSEKVESNKIRENFRVADDKKIIIYQGAVLKGRGIAPLAEAIRDKEEYVLFIAGDGPFLPEIKSIYNIEIESGKIICAGKINYSELHEWTCSADIGCALFEPVSLSYELALPNKLFEYCMAGIPSLATDLPAIRSVVEKYPFARLVERGLKQGHILAGLADIEKRYCEYTSRCEEGAAIYNYGTQKSALLSLVKNV